jgi:hypothetical protein
MHLPKASLVAPDLQLSRYTSEMISTPKINTVSMEGLNMRVQSMQSMNTPHGAETSGGQWSRTHARLATPILPAVELET